MARITASTKLPLRLLFCLRGETTNQLKWHCVWQFGNCGPVVAPLCHTRFATHLSMCPYLLKDSEILFSTSVVQLHEEGAVAATKGWHLRQKEIEPVAMPQYRPV